MKLIHRIKILLAVLQELSGNIEKNDFHQLLFLYCKEFVENNHYYDFIPQETGPFSIQAEADKEYLTKKSVLENSQNWVSKSNERFATSLDFFEKIAIQEMKNKLGAKSGDELKAYVSEKYPEFFANNSSENNSGEITLFTIGYEGLSPETYLNKLLENGVKLLCDVRKNAYSQKFGFSKNELKNSLEKVGIEYLHIPELGIISEKRHELNEFSDYQKLFDEYEAQTLKNNNKIDLLLELLNKHRHLAITCFEADSHYCHRSRVADKIEGFGVEVKNL